MGEAILCGQSGGGGIKINGILERYGVYTGETIKAGDFVDIVNVQTGTNEYTSTLTQISNTTYTGRLISATLLSNNRIFMAHSGTSDNKLYGSLISIVNGEIIPHVTTLLKESSYVYGGSSCVKALTLDDNHVFVIYCNTGNYTLESMILEVSSDSFSIVSERQLCADDVSGELFDATVMSDGVVFVAHRYNSYYDYLYGTVVKIANNAVSSVYTNSLRQSDMYAYSDISVARLSDTRVFIYSGYYGSKSYYGTAYFATLSGTTFTSRYSDYSTVKYVGRYHCAIPLDENRAFVACCYSTSYNLYGMVWSYNGSTISSGTAVALNSGDSTCSASPCAVMSQSGNVVIFHPKSFSYNLYGVVASISDMTVTKAGSNYELDLTSYCAYSPSAVVLDDGYIFVAYASGGTSSTYYLSGILYDENFDNVIEIPVYEEQVQKTTTAQFDGIAKTGGSDGSTVSVYTL